MSKIRHLADELVRRGGITVLTPTIEPRIKTVLQIDGTVVNTIYEDAIHDDALRQQHKRAVQAAVAPLRGRLTGTLRTISQVMQGVGWAATGSGLIRELAVSESSGNGYLVIAGTGIGVVTRFVVPRVVRWWTRLSIRRAVRTIIHHAAVASTEDTEKDNENDRRRTP